ncbi:MAG: DNA-deoxyinosine glycosylase [Planctomycetota bacterium]
MAFAESFPPIAAPGARVLILGSMPGVASLEAGQYYAHPRNAFWPIMGRLYGAGPGLPYAERCGRLQAAGVAVWDVLRQCRRAGSLDSAIERDSESANDIAGLLHECPAIGLIAFNGRKAEQAFNRHVRQNLTTSPPKTVCLPSTSPAHAARSLDQKTAIWRAALLE